MAKSKKRYSSFDLDFLGESVLTAVGMQYARMEELYGNIAEPLQEAYKHAAAPFNEEVTRAVSPGGHHQTGTVLKSYNAGTFKIENDGEWMTFYMGFDVRRGGWPALILEYGDSGSPLRCPNEPKFIIYKATKRHLDDMYEINEKLVEFLKKVLNSRGQNVG